MPQNPPKRSPGRPSEFADRVSKVVRLDPDLDERLKAAASNREISANRLINRAIADYLDRLIPVDELLRTRS